MKLLTEVQLPDYPFQIDHRTPVLMMGSCFTDNVGQLLEKYLFPVSINPFGVTYNPLSVLKGLEALVEKKEYVAEDLDHYKDLWFSFDHYTGFSSPNQEEALSKINDSFGKAKKLLGLAETLILTWGTAWIYRYNQSGEIVCNCHKIPASQFTRTQLSTREIIKAYEDFIPRLLKFNPNLKIILTVSPVRHWKDGAHGNQLSKATLLLAGEALMNLFPEQLFYFPSYEIVMDELRDYRFYSEDLLHLSDQAIQYIWEKFESSLISIDSRKIIKDLIPLLKMLNHRPLIREGASYEKLLADRKEKLDNFKIKYPFIEWNNLIEN